MKSKACKFCDGTTHSSIMCFQKPRNTILKNKKFKYLRPKADHKWIEVRHQWLQDNPPVNGGYACHYCKHFVFYEEVTLDHKTPRSGLGVSKKYDLDNLVPCCACCNAKKGSIQYETFIKNSTFINTA